MNKVLLLLFSMFVIITVNAQVITTNPALPTDMQSVVITFNADQGSKGLMNYTGDVYAHTGVITDKSTSDSDWKYVKSSWGVNTPDCKLTRVSANVYTLNISNSIRQYYGVPSTEKIKKMAFVFRSGVKVGSNYLEGKDTGGKDIFYNVYEAGVNVTITSPASALTLHPQGLPLQVEVSATNNDRIDLYLNQDLIHTQNGQSLSYALTTPVSGKHMLRAVAVSSSATAADTAYFLVHQPTVSEVRPSHLKTGINRISDQETSFVLFAPHKEYIYLIGDFNEWVPEATHQLKKDGDFFWITLNGLSPNVEYGFQYWIDGALKIADPYAEKVLDSWNDKYIPNSVYPNLKQYPVGKTEEAVSVFTTNKVPFQWSVSNFVGPKADDLVIYEMLIRDFTANKDIKTITDTLAYLKRLGVNAIELMPFNEFEGNDSWGYNPSFYFATDKAYGTPSDYKRFIDECHKNGMAVIMDMVLNHSYGQSPLVRMYFDNDRPAANNPWYNQASPNTSYSWGYDFNHESEYTRQFIDSVASYWMNEFKIDGFRYDFTKGFTNTPGDGWARDNARIAILTRMADEVWKRNPNAYVIFEHLADNSEETILANHGVLLWGNLNGKYSEATMSYHESGKSDFSWISYKTRGWSKPHLIGYMESHDEERMMFRNVNYGKTTSTYNIKDTKIALRQQRLAGAFYFTIPGPKMIWQFGELGYDVSIDDGGRLGQKPPKWDYLQDSDRRKLLQVWSSLIDLKKTEPVFKTTNFVLDVAGSVKKIALNHSGSDLRIVGNFDVTSKTVSPGFSSTGKWYDYFNRDSITVTDVNMQVNLNPGEFIIFSQKKLKGYDVQTGIFTPSVRQAVIAYPNPFSSFLKVENPYQGQALFEVYNLSGRLIESKISANQWIDFNTQAWAKGVYLLKVTGQADSGHIQKIVKN